MATHDCPVTGCGTSVPYSMLMCATHWREVPRDLQREVTRAWRERRNARSSGKAMRAHLQACEDAVASVEGREPVELFA